MVPSISIPPQLREPELRFIKVEHGGKAPIEAGWKNPRGLQRYAWNHPVLEHHLMHDGNYGILPGYLDLCIIDADQPQYLANLGISSFFNETFAVRSGRDGSGYHFYFKSPGIQDFFDEGRIGLVHPKITRTDKNGKKEPIPLGGLYLYGNSFCVGPGSIHPSGRQYTIVRDAPIQVYNPLAVKVALRTVLPKPKPLPIVVDLSDYEPGGTKCPDLPDLSHIRITDVCFIPDGKARGAEIQGSNPHHGSNTGANFAINTRKDVWRCFRDTCNSGGGPLEWVAVEEGIISCQDAGPGCLRGEKFTKVVAALKRRGLIQ